MRVRDMPGGGRVYYLFGYVPVTVVVKNQTHIVSIVVGAVTDKNFWLNLACRELDGKIYFYQGTDLVAVIGEESTQENNIPGELVAGIVAICIPIAAVGGYYLYKYRHVFSRRIRQFKHSTRLKKVKRISK